MTDTKLPAVLPLRTIAHYNSAFSEDLPGLQLYWDSTSYDHLKTCPFYYYLTNIQGYTPKARNIHLTFGIAWHSALERFHKLRASGENYEQALFWTIAETYYRQLLTPREKAQAQGFHEEALPPAEKVAAKNPAVLLRALVAYLDTHEGDNAHTLILPDGSAAVELSFSFSLGDSPFFWNGHLDRVVSLGQEMDLSKPSQLQAQPPQLFVTDYKTTTSELNEYYWSQYSPDIQMTGYTIAGKVAFHIPVKGVMVDAVRLSVTGEEFARCEITRSPNNLDEFLDDLTLDLSIAQLYAERQSWPKNPKSCRRYGRDCEYRNVCMRSSSSRVSHVRSVAHRRFWNPRQER